MRKKESLNSIVFVLRACEAFMFPTCQPPWKRRHRTSVVLERTRALTVSRGRQTNGIDIGLLCILLVGGVLKTGEFMLQRSCSVSPNNLINNHFPWPGQVVVAVAKWYSYMLLGIFFHLCFFLLAQKFCLIALRCSRGCKNICLKEVFNQKTSTSTQKPIGKRTTDSTIQCSRWYTVVRKWVAEWQWKCQSNGVVRLISGSV